MKRNIITAILALCPLALAAQINAQGVLGRLSAKIASLGDYKVAFSAEAEGRTVSGSYVVSGERYYMDAADIEIVCDGRTRYEINHTDREVLIDKVNPEDRNILSNPTRAFDFASDSFTASYQGVKAVNGKQCDVVALKPLAKKSSVTNVVLAVGKDSGLPVELRYGADGLDGDVVVSVKTFARDTVPDSLFGFDKNKYPGYELVDFR